MVFPMMLSSDVLYQSTEYNPIKIMYRVKRYLYTANITNIISNFRHGKDIYRYKIHKRADAPV